MKVRGLRSFFMVTIVLIASLTSCSNEQEPLVGKWSFEKMEYIMLDGALTITVKPTAGEIILMPDHSLKGYVVLPPFGHGPDRQELSGKIIVDSVAKTVQLQLKGDNRPASGSYRLVRDWGADYLEIVLIIRENEELPEAQYKNKIHLVRKSTAQ